MARPGTFKPGVSGNPKGRSKKVRHIEAVAMKYANEVIEVFVDILRNGQTDQAKVAAGKEILDRAYGKAPQAIAAAISGNIVLKWES